MRAGLCYINESNTSQFELVLRRARQPIQILAALGTTAIIEDDGTAAGDQISTRLTFHEVQEREGLTQRRPRVHQHDRRRWLNVMDRDERADKQDQQYANATSRPNAPYWLVADGDRALN